MSKELKAPDKVTQKMTRDGAVAENLTTGETTSISKRPPEENYSAPAAGAAEKATQRIGTEVSRHLEKGAEKKALDAAQLKTHTSRLQFSEAERATPELQKAKQRRALLLKRRISPQTVNCVITRYPGRRRNWTPPYMEKSMR